ncbi:MAG: hypothetical protein OEX08_01105 [Candidatus Nomurabacteria bacterium]|nr:hypothetical protein [Candidatus Nomurabacteria bacterium]
MKKLSLSKIIGGIGIWMVPAFAFAQQNVTGIITLVKNLINTIIPILITIVIVLVIFNVIKMVTAGKETPEDKEKYKNNLIRAIIGLFVIVAIWGIVGILVNTLFPGGVSPVPINQIPQIPNL